VVHAIGFLPVGEGLTYDALLTLSGAFAPLVAMSCSPFIALTTLSAFGNLLNAGVLNPENFPLAQALMPMTIAQIDMFVVLLIITSLKFMLSLLSSSKIVCDATLGRIESVVGTICTVLGAFLVTTATSVYAASIITSATGSMGVLVYILTNIVAFVVAVLAYVVFFVIRTMIVALDALSILLVPIPGATGIFTVVSHITFGFYALLALTSPLVASVIGLCILAVAFAICGWANRIMLYYRRIYLVPFANALLRREIVLPLIPKRLPRGVATQFGDVEICLEGFCINASDGLRKRELCYFIRSQGVNYIFKRRFLGKRFLLNLSNDTYIERTFRFVRVFTDALPPRQRGTSIEIRREHTHNIEKLVSKAGLIDYNRMQEVRKRGDIHAK